MQPLTFKTGPRRALVVSMRYLGDALLATTTVAALKRTWPECEVDMLTFVAASAILEGNPLVSNRIVVDERPSLPTLLRTLISMWRQYDLAVVPQVGTRPFVYGWAAGRRSVGFVSESTRKSWWKSLLLDRAVSFSEKEPTVLENLRIAQLAGARFNSVEILAPRPAESLPAITARLNLDLEHRRYVVIHPEGRGMSKRWTTKGWRSLIDYLTTRRYHVMVTGGPGANERDYIAAILDDLPAGSVHNLQGKLSIAESAEFIRHAEAFVGIDTATTHVAAATGTPTVAIFGPTNPVIWGPWGGARYEKSARVQLRGAVSLIQNPSFACVPCQQEGCERRRTSRSECLDELPADRVIAEVERVLKTPRSQ